jgi:hypothetical protein
MNSILFRAEGSGLSGRVPSKCDALSSNPNITKKSKIFKNYKEKGK